jgi:uncharacterized protein YndB with AHSA1/START domain
MDIRYHNTIYIQKPTSEVYAYLSDFPRHTEWAQTLERLEKVKDGDHTGVGAQYLTYEKQSFQSDRQPHGPIKQKLAIKAQTMCEVRELVPNKRLAWHAHMVGDPGTHADWEIDLTPEGEGGTRLSQKVFFVFGPLPGWVGVLLFMEKRAFRQFDAGLQNIKLILEGQVQASQLGQPARITAEKNLYIEASPEHVYRYATDIRRHAEWAFNPLEIVHVAGPDSGLGATFKSVARRTAGFVGTFRGLIKVVSDAPPYRFVYDVQDDSGSYRWTMLFEAEGSGTRIIHRFEKYAGPWVLWFLQPTLIWPMVGSKQVAGGLANLKAKLEAGPTSAAERLAAPSPY